MKRELEAQRGRGPSASTPSRHRRARAVTSAETPDAVPAEAVVKHYETVTTVEALDAWARRVEAAELAALDAETDSLDAVRAQLIGLSMAVGRGEACYIPLAHNYAGAPDQLHASRSCSSGSVRGWRTRRLPRSRTTPSSAATCSKAPASRCAATVTTRCSRAMCWKRTARTASRASRSAMSAGTGVTYEDVCGKGANQIALSQVEIGRAAEYACEDSDLALDVHRVLAPLIDAEPGIADVYRRIEMPMSEILGRIERTGVLIDSALLNAQSHELGRAHVGARAGGLRAGGPAVQPRQPEADRRDPVRQARPAGRPGRPRAARRRPTRTCCRSSPPTIRCPASCSSTAASRS